MNPNDIVELDGSMRDVAQRLHWLLAEKAATDGEINELKAKLRSTLTPGQKGTIDGTPVIAVAANRRFDPDYALTVLPPELAALCVVTVLDSKRAREVLPPAIYASCMREVGEPVVRAL